MEGRAAKAKYTFTENQILDTEIGWEVMSDWEDPIMVKHAEIVTKNGGDIGILSNNNIALTSPKEVVIEAPTTKIGSVNATEPMVLGDILESKLNDILTLIETGLLAPTGPVVVGPGAGILASLKSTLSQIKSPNNKVE